MVSEHSIKIVNSYQTTSGLALLMEVAPININILTPVNSTDADETSSHNNVVGYSKRKRDNGITPEIVPNKLQKHENNDEDLFNNSDLDSNSSMDSGNSHVTKNINDKQNTATRQRVPPIVVTLTNNNTLWDLKTKIKKIAQEAIYNCNGKQVSIQVKSDVLRNKIIELLAKHGADFHTFARKEDIQPKLVLKGLPVLPIEIIKDELQRQQIKTVGIHMIRNKNNQNLNQATYLVTVESIKILKETLKIKYLDNVVIKWEKYLKPSKITQCNKCQRFGHGKTNCHHKPNCMKCAGEHLTTECTIEDTIINNKCYNCNGNHRANDSTCPILIKYINNKNNNKNNKDKNQLTYQVNTNNKNYNNPTTVASSTTGPTTARTYAAVAMTQNFCQKCNITKPNLEGCQRHAVHDGQQPNVNNVIYSGPINSEVNNKQQLLCVLVDKLSMCSVDVLNKVIEILNVAQVQSSDNSCENPSINKLHKIISVDKNAENKKLITDSIKDVKQNSNKKNTGVTEVDAIVRDSTSKLKVNKSAPADKVNKENKDSNKNKYKTGITTHSRLNKSSKINENKIRNNG